MKSILTVVALSSFIATPAFATELSEIMSGKSHQLSTSEMQRTVGAGFATSISINQADNTALFGSVFNSQFSTSTATAAFPFSVSQAQSGNIANNLAIGGFINSFQDSNANAFAF